ncbi:MAG: ABC transporter ATP-binding protein [Clostridium sp.]|nr:ABC transporter ATP-binding protein [Clostridium sp.]
MISSEKVLGSIEFRNVKFSYSEKESIIKGLDFKINPGENVAIIGRNGAGKTTIINLILRFLTPTSGEILLDGKDINSIKLSDYRNLISMVSQEIYLFNKTIRENIMINSKKADAEMYSVVEKCGADKFIEEMPDKYESIVGERGSKLSGGERQKVAMARALLRESKILILDEATANYDIKAEQEINDVIRENYKDKTTIMITHRPDVLRQVDKVIVINDGQVEDMGNHEELYERNEFYRQMVSVTEGVSI